MPPFHIYQPCLTRVPGPDTLSTLQEVTGWHDQIIEESSPLLRPEWECFLREPRASNAIGDTVDYATHQINITQGLMGYLRNSLMSAGERAATGTPDPTHNTSETIMREYLPMLNEFHDPALYASVKRDVEEHLSSLRLPITPREHLAYHLVPLHHSECSMLHGTTGTSPADMAKALSRVEAPDGVKAIWDRYSFHVENTKTALKLVDDIALETMHIPFADKPWQGRLDTLRSYQSQIRSQERQTWMSDAQLTEWLNSKYGEAVSWMAIEQTEGGPEDQRYRGAITQRKHELSEVITALAPAAEDGCDPDDIAAILEHVRDNAPLPVD